MSYTFELNNEVKDANFATGKINAKSAVVEIFSAMASCSLFAVLHPVNNNKDMTIVIVFVILRVNINTYYNFLLRRYIKNKRLTTMANLFVVYV